MPSFELTLNALLAGRYRIERELGSGGMGSVYLAEDLRHARRVALKVLRPELTEMLGIRRFVDETRVTATLQHPHILPLFDSGEVGGYLFYVMPYVRGESLRSRLAREGALPVADAARILRDVVEGLGSAHQQGVVHRDIKPENILLAERSAVIADFGIATTVSATAVTPQRNTAGVALGTPAYMAPEMLSEDPHVDHRVDLYATGAMAYEMLTGKPPFADRATPQVLMAHLVEAPRPISELRNLPSSLATLVMRCLEKHPADRYQRAEDMLPPLEAAAAGLRVSSAGKLDVSDKPVSPVSAPPRRGRRFSPRTVAGVLAMLLFAGGLWIVSSRRPSDPDAASPTKRARMMVLASASEDVGAADWSNRAVASVARAIDSTDAVDLVPQVALGESRSTDRRSLLSLARKASATHAVSVSVTRAGGGLALRAEIVEVGDGVARLVHGLGPDTASNDSMAAAVDRMGRRAATAVVLLFRGISLPLRVERLPGNPEVFSRIERSSEHGCDIRFAAALVEVRGALVLEPTYVPALGTLAYLLAASGEWRAADSVGATLDRLRPRMLPSERLWWDYQRAVTQGDWTSATLAAEKGFRADAPGWGQVAGFVALSTHRVIEARDRLAAARPMAWCFLPQSGVFRLRAEVDHLLGRHEEELARAVRFQRQFPGNTVALESAVNALAALGRTVELDSVLDVIDATPSAEGALPLFDRVRASLELRAHGHTVAAERVLRRALSRSVVTPDTPAMLEGRALALLGAGRWVEADRVLRALLARAPEQPGLLRYHGVALARMGRREEALAIDHRLAAITTRPPGLSFYYRAAIAGALGDARAASSLLERAFESGYGFDARFHRDLWWDPIRRDAAFLALMRFR